MKWSIQLIDESAKVPFSKTNQQDLVALFSVMRAEEDSLVDEDEGNLYDALMLGRMRTMRTGTKGRVDYYGNSIRLFHAR